MSEQLYESEFDQYVEEYDNMHKFSTRHSGFDTSYFDQYKIDILAREFKGRANEPLKILNFGCGIGKSEPLMIQKFPNCKIYSIDVSKKSVEYGLEKNKHLLNHIEYAHFDGIHLPTQEKFDIIFIANVFHHIEFQYHKEILINLRQALSEKGYLYMFEHNPANPLTLKAVKDCCFDGNARLLSSAYTKKLYASAGFSSIDINYTLFFPAFLNFMAFMERYMTFIPIGAQYYCKAK